MAAFIVISTSNRLHYLVDGVEKCRPLNPSVETHISTGKISLESEGYFYHYRVAEKESDDETKVDFCNLLSNQLAEFRKECSISKEQSVNIFLLENPLSEEDYRQDEMWLAEFDKVYGKGHGSDTGFRLFRVLFTYDIEKPKDVRRQIEPNLLKEILDKNKKLQNSRNDGESNTLEQFIFYIDNQNSDAAALCLDKKDQDLKMPRYLLDFMMLVSNPADSYGVFDAITSTESFTKCFAVGYAESMYYFKDVERYFREADQRDLLDKFLNWEDETEINVCEDMMDVSKHPFGLKKRKENLSKKYVDVPFDKNIEEEEYSDSADKSINDYLMKLRDKLISERQEEFEKFEQSEKAIEIKGDIDKYKSLLSEVKMAEGENMEQFNSRLSQLKCQIKDAESKLQKMRNDFVKCPEFIDRKAIYEKFRCVKGKAKDQDASHYWNLVNYICSEDFFHYVKGEDDIEHKDSQPLQGNQSDVNENNNKKGCLGWLCFWKRTPATNINNIGDGQSIKDSLASSKEDYVSCIEKIKELLDLKQDYQNFIKEIERIEEQYSESQKVCDDFKLTVHSNSCYPLINIEDLKSTQKEDFKSIFDKCYKEWLKKGTPTKSLLESLVKEESKRNVMRYSYIDWNNRFSFIQELPKDSLMPKLCNKLEEMSTPFVNYNITTEIAEDRVVKSLYSDIPTIVDDFKEIKSKLNNGNAITPYCSSHIVSKLCMMQFLPMDDKVLENLVDLHTLESVPEGKSES